MRATSDSWLLAAIGAAGDGLLVATGDGQLGAAGVLSPLHRNVLLLLLRWEVLQPLREGSCNYPLPSGGLLSLYPPAGVCAQFPQ